MPLKEDLSKGKMLRFQDSLPKLPVPSLEETCAKFLKTLEPLAAQEPSRFNLAETKRKLMDFVGPNGLGPILQTRLTAKAADPAVKNWLYDWWNESAYMAYRDPVVPYVSYFYAHKDDKLRMKNLPYKAASIVKAVLRFKQLVDSKQLEPEYMRKNPLCMDSYQYMFNTCRIPKQSADGTVQYPPEQNPYFVVMRKNRFFKVPHLFNGKEVSTTQLYLQFQAIYNYTEYDSPNYGSAIGALTSANRDEWTAYRETLLAASPEINGTALKTIEAASFIVCLDTEKPVTLEERAHQFWHGDGKNRFYDKPLQFIICDNGVSGFLGEHSMMDGTPTHRLNDTILHMIFQGRIDLELNPEAVEAGEVAKLQEISEISFIVNSHIEENISKAEQSFSCVISQHEVAVTQYKRYGKQLIKKFRCSPDAYVQMLLQLAYYKLEGVSRPTYESAATRQFQLGRTETCRSVSNESVAFVKKFSDPKASAKEKIAAARAALNAHSKYISQASQGKGVDRHFFGLKKCYNAKTDGPLPEIFTDPLFIYSGTWYISSSQLSSEYYVGYGWSQVIDDGFGLAYMVNDDFINVNVCSKYKGSEKLRFYIVEAADEMAEAFSVELQEKEKEKKEKAKL